MYRIKRKLMIGILVALLFVITSLSTTCNLYMASIPVNNSKGDEMSLRSVQEELTQLATNEMRKKKVTGMSMAVVDENGILFTINLGYADKDKKIPVSADTLYKIGSISKLFTATAVMQLAEEGKLDIDEPLSAYIPEFSIKSRYGDDELITLRTLMTHRSGLPGNYLPEVLNPEYPYFTAIVVDIKEEYAAYPPNYITAYSNIGSTLLGVVIERATGQKFNDYVIGHILNPLEMYHSSFELRNDMVALSSLGYYNNKPARDDICPDRISPEGSLRSSVNEMSHFMQMILRNGSYKNNEIIKEATLKEMLTPQTHLPLDLDGNGLDTTGSIGLNWFLYQDPDCGSIVMHPGGTRLFFSRMTILKDFNFGVIVLTNSVNGEALTEKLTTETIIRVIKATNGPGNYPSDIHNASLEIKPVPLKGDYATEFGWVTVEPTKKYYSMKIQKYPNTVIKLEKSEEGWNSCKPLLMGLFPTKIMELEGLQFGTFHVGGEEVLLVKDKDNLRIFGEKVDMTSIPEIWSKRCGIYKETDYHGVAGLGYKLQLQLDHGRLIGYVFNEKGMKSEPFSLTPINETELLKRGIGRNMQETLRVINLDGREGLTFEGLLFQR